MRYAISMDVGGTTIKTGIVADDGSVWQPGQVPTPPDPAALIERCAQIVTEYDRLISEGEVAGPNGPISPSEIVDTIGFDLPGIVDEAHGMAVFSANLGWTDFPAQSTLQEATGRPVAFGHDVRTGAYAEAHWGVALDNFFYIAIGTGIATVLILNRTPVAASDWAGELGQIPVPNWDGEPMPLEQIASASGIARRAASLGLINENEGAAAVYKLVDAGSTQAKEVVDFAIKTLAGAVAPVIAAVGKVPVVLGGGLANRGDDLFDHLSQELNDALGIVPGPQVLGAKLGSQSQLKGAGLRALSAK